MNFNPKVIDYLDNRKSNGPVLVIDLDRVTKNYRAFERWFSSTRIYYAIKANPDAAILSRLVELGSAFDAASVEEIRLALSAGAACDDISFGNTIKKERDIAAALELGVRLFAVDCFEEVEKIARRANALGVEGVRVFCRILCDGDGAEWPLSRKFGCEPDLAPRVLAHAHALGLVPCGVSFHVGSQQANIEAWDAAIASAASIFRACEKEGFTLDLVNLGGGFPTPYLRPVPVVSDYARAVSDALSRHFGNHIPRTIIEPGRGMVGDAGVIEAEVVLVSRKSTARSEPRWVYLDIGKFGGLAETMDEAIRYPIRTKRDDDPKEPCILAGPTCDSADVLYEKNPYPLPRTIAAGDKVLIEGTGAYTSTYSAVAFNGFAPLQTVVID